MSSRERLPEAEAPPAGPMTRSACRRRASNGGAAPLADTSWREDTAREAAVEGRPEHGARSNRRGRRPAPIDEAQPTSMEPQQKRPRYVIDLDADEDDDGAAGGGRAPPAAGGAASETTLTQFTCAICLEPPAALSATRCGHLFCDYCIRSVLDSNARQGRCPICRQRLTASSIIPLAIKIS